MTVINFYIKQTVANESDKSQVAFDNQKLVLDLKEHLQDIVDIPKLQQRLVYRGQVMKDDRSIDSYGLQDGHVVHIVKGRPAGPSTQSQPETNNSSTQQQNQQRGTQQDPIFQAIQGQGQNANGTGFGLDQGQGGMGQMGGMNPEMMQNMMNMPFMQQLMSDPNMIRQVMQSNPQLQQVMNNNPEVAQMLTDPQRIQEAMRLYSNPSLLREHMRNMDRAMSNIENIPEGYNMLRRMYEDVQEPLDNALTSEQFQNSLVQSQQPNQTNNQNPPNPNATTAEANPATNPPSQQNETLPPGTTPNSNPLPNPWAQNNQTQGNNTNPALGIPTGGIPGMGGLGGLDPALLGGAGGLGGGGLFGDQLGNMDPEQMNMIRGLVQQPMFQQQMQEMRRNPMMRQMMMQQIRSSPMMQQMTQQNPMLEQMLQNPQFMDSIWDPNLIQQTLSHMSGQQNQQQGNQQQQDANPQQNSFQNNEQMANLLQQMMGGAGAQGQGGNQTQQPQANNTDFMQQLLRNMPQPQGNPETNFATQLEQLQEMGFYDREQNIRALQMSGGNVNAAVSRILDGTV